MRVPQNSSTLPLTAISKTHFRPTRLPRLAVFTAAVIGAGVLVFQTAYAATNYDPATGFSSSLNPNGPWSYGASAGLGGVFTPHTEHDQFYLTLGLEAWNSASIASVSYNATSSPITYTGGSDNVVWQPHHLSLHPGYGGSVSVVRFTVPAAGAYQVAGFYDSVDQYFGATTDVHILKNGVSVFDDTIMGKTDVANFDQALQLAAGDFVDFAVGEGSYAVGWDSTGLQVQITTVPEPATLSLLVLGLCFLGRTRKVN